MMNEVSVEDEAVLTGGTSFEYEEEGNGTVIGDNESVISESMAAVSVTGGINSGNSNGPRRKSSFFGFGYTNTSRESGSSGNSRSQMNFYRNLFRVQNHEILQAIGKQIRFIEEEFRKMEESKAKLWKEEVKPILEASIDELTLRTNKLQQDIEAMASMTNSSYSMEKEKEKVLAGISKLEERLESVQQELEHTKRSYYFPTKRYTLGQQGVYLGIDDYWIEYLSGGLSLQLLPPSSNNKQHSTPPCLLLTLQGNQYQEAQGVQARVQCEGFTLFGEKGKGVPKVSFNTLKVTLSFIVEIYLVYDTITQKWIIGTHNQSAGTQSTHNTQPQQSASQPSSNSSSNSSAKKGFQIKLLSFKGPYGLSRGIVSMILSLITPTIRTLVLASLPVELGRFLCEALPCPLSLQGDFSLEGLELALLDYSWTKVLASSGPLSTSTSVVTMLLQLLSSSPAPPHNGSGSSSSINALQVEMWLGLQRALERTSTALLIQSVSDSIRYLRTYHPLYSNSNHNNHLLAGDDLNSGGPTANKGTPAPVKDPITSLAMGMWEQLRNLWNQACLLYSERVEEQMITVIASQQLPAAMTTTTTSAGARSYSPPPTPNHSSADDMAGPQLLQLIRPISFDTFVLKLGENLLMKRVSLACSLAHCDITLSLHPTIQIIHDFMIRMTSEALAKLPKQSKTYTRLRLQSVLDKLKQGYSHSQHLLGLLTQNLDFGEASLYGRVDSGPEGSVLVHLTDLIAQLPLLLQLTLREDKNIGVLPLVPYILSVQPQSSTGDCLMEMYHFTYDTADMSLWLSAVDRDKEKEKGSSSMQQRSKEHTNYLNSIQTGYYITSYNTLVTNITSKKVLPRTPGVLAKLAELLNEEENDNVEEEQSSSGTHTPPPRPAFILLPVKSTTLSSATAHSAAGGTQAKAPQQLQPQKSYSHLLTQREQQYKQREAVLLDHPSRDEADTLISMLFSAPQVSVTVDRSMEFRAGSELVSMVMGPVSEQWKPMGSTPNMFTQQQQIISSQTLAEQQQQEMLLSDVNVKETTPAISREKKSSNGSVSSSSAGGGGSSVTSSATPQPPLQGPPTLASLASSAVATSAAVADTQSQPQPQAQQPPPIKTMIGGMPILLQTAPAIKLLVQIKRCVLSIHLPTLFRFTLAHFANYTLLRKYLESLLGGEFPEELLQMSRLIIEKVSKYCLLPLILSLEINLRAELRTVKRRKRGGSEKEQKAEETKKTETAEEKEIIVKLTTPDRLEQLFRGGSGIGEEESTGSAAGGGKGSAAPPQKAITFRAHISLQEVSEDVADILAYLREGGSATHGSSNSNSEVNGTKKSAS